MAKLLTRKMLEDWGITVTWDEENNKWNVTRYWYKNNSKTKMELRQLKQTILRCKHKYTQDKEYPGYVFGDGHNHSVTVPAGRLIWAYFNGECPADKDVDHIDNNPFNNKIENLQLLTREENIKKRYTDNPNGCWNHHQAIKKYHKE